MRRVVLGDCEKEKRPRIRLWFAELSHPPPVDEMLAALIDLHELVTLILGEMWAGAAPHRLMEVREGEPPNSTSSLQGKATSRSLENATPRQWPSLSSVSSESETRAPSYQPW